MTVEAMDLAQAVQDFRAERLRQQQAAEQSRLHRQEEITQRWVEGFRSWLDTGFSAEMKAAINLHPPYTIIDEDVLLWVNFEAMGRTFSLVWRNAMWCGLRLFIPAEERYYVSHTTVSNDHDLIVAMAELFEIEERSLALVAEAEQAMRIRDEDRRAALEMHQGCLARIERFRAAIVPWEWPRFREIDIAHWRWCIAPAVDGSEPEYDYGYSLQHRIYDSGNLKLEAERHKPHAARTVVLPATSIPIASLTTVTRLAELPEPLVQHRTVTVSGIREDYSQHDAEGKPLLIEDEAAVMKIELPERWPVAWVRDALTR